MIPTHTVPVAYAPKVDAVPSDDTPGVVVVRTASTDWFALSTDQARELADDLIKSARERDTWDVNRTAGAENLPTEYTDSLASDLGFTRVAGGPWTRGV